MVIKHSLSSTFLRILPVGGLRALSITQLNAPFMSFATYHGRVRSVTTRNLHLSVAGKHQNLFPVSIRYLIEQPLDIVCSPSETQQSTGDDFTAIQLTLTLKALFAESPEEKKEREEHNSNGLEKRLKKEFHTPQSY